MIIKVHPPQEELSKMFKYINDGRLVWKKRKIKTNSFAGKVAGCKNTPGYIVIRINRVLYHAHRLVWIIHNGKIGDGVIDHLNGIKTDNRIENLRLTDHSNNSTNIQKPPKDNSTGYMGVCFDKFTKSYKASININKKLKHLGRFKTAEEAAKIVNDAIVKYRTPPYYLNPIP